MKDELDFDVQSFRYLNIGKSRHQIDVPDTIPCNLSVSVTDASINPSHPGEEDIFSGILLTSEIKGYVYNPAYYFSGNQDSITDHLDLDKDDKWLEKIQME